ncbi:MAG: Crp/Fnr family transcriptional regulator [Parvularculaceae bacterium]
MDSLFIRLRHYAEIGDEERDALAAMPTRRAEYAAGDTIVAQGDDPIEAFIVNKGWAARYIALEDGRTQILNFMLPGDMFDFQVFVASSADHSISAITSLEILKIRRRDILAVFRSGTNAGAAFWWAALQEEAMLREQIVRNGRRSARERIAHLF